MLSIIGFIDCTCRELEYEHKVHAELSTMEFYRKKIALNQQTKTFALF